MIKQDAYTGFTALELILELTPRKIKEEAIWWAHTDGLKGHTIKYLGSAHGMRIWETSDGTRVRLRAKPTPLSREENERIEAAVKVWYARSWAEQVEKNARFHS